MEKNRGALSSNLDKNGVLRKRKSRSESDDDLSDIDDEEVRISRFFFFRFFLNFNTKCIVDYRIS